MVGFLSLLLAAESLRIALATRIGKSNSVTQMKKAVSLDPANPGLHFRLGTAEIYDLGNPDTADGMGQLRRATELSPHETRYWTALASACEFEGDRGCADGAIAKTLSLSPMTPGVHWEAANYYLWANEQSQALSQFQRLLELDPHYAEAAFRVTLEATGSPEVVYNRVLPPDASPKLKLAYINFLATHGHRHSAFHVWKEVVVSRPQFKFPTVNPYLDHLIGSRQYQTAATVWRDLEQRGVLGQTAEHDPNNLVFNGGFERVPLDAGFDWRYRQEPYVSVDFRARQAYAGKYCLRLNFSDVENHQDEPVYQLVPVVANQEYQLTAYIRSANIDSHSCPRLRVVDPACPTCVSVTSSPVKGTTPWHKVVLNFQTGPQTHLVRLSVWRPRSLDYPTAILGTLWLDQVSIRAVGSVSSQPGRRQDS